MMAQFLLKKIPLFNILLVVCCVKCEPPVNVVNNHIYLSQLNTAALQQNMANAAHCAHDALNEHRKKFISGIDEIVEYISHHKKRCFLYSLLVSYLGAIASLWYLQHAINKGHWKSWKNESSLEVLFSIKQQDLAQQLLLDIQLHYINPTAPTDTAEPISKFLIDIAQEEYYLKKYLELLAWLERWHIARFIYFKTEKQKYEEYAKRINCLKSLFTLWLSEYKISLLQDKQKVPSSIATS